jgi:uncharacterized protein GlcG (DUF336 family)
MRLHLRRTVDAILCVALLSACSGGGGSSGGGPASADLGGSGIPGTANLRVCDGSCAMTGASSGDPSQMRSLGMAQVSTVLQQAVAEAQARSAGATIAIVDRAGNVLAVAETGAAPQTIAIGSNPNTVAFPGNGLEDVPGGATRGSASTPTAVANFVAALTGGDPNPAATSPLISARFAAISKAITAAYLSTEGNAFTTETASQIIQENFNPGEGSRIGGPLFGVQISQLVCDDITRRQSIVSMAQGTAGPKSAPIGFSGDPGGIPLYMAGEMVGAIGVEVDGNYSVQTNIVGREFVSVEAIIALAGQRSFEANDDRKARRITVDGRSLRYSDSENAGFASAAATALAAPGSVPAGAQLVDVMNFFQASGGIRAGTVFLTPQSGYMIIPGNTLGGVPLTGPARQLVNMDASSYLGQNIVDPASDPNAVVLTMATPNPRPSFSPTVADGGLTATEAATLVAGGLGVARRAKALIRRGIQGPGRPFMEVNVSVVDLAGNLLAFAGTPDAPVFGTTVSIQKARASTFFSRRGGEDPRITTSAADDMMADVEPDLLGLTGLKVQSKSIGTYVIQTRNFIGPNSLAFADGIAFADRSIGNLARPFFPDGIAGAASGPLSQPLATPNPALNTWSPFNTGLQLDLVLNQLLVGLLTNQEGGMNPIQTTCTGPNLLELRGGIQIFPGSVAIYKNGKLVGGMGISGDGVDQDDLIAFEGLKQGGIALGGTGTGSAGMNSSGTGFLVGNAPRAVRSDQIRIPGQNSNNSSGNLRYVNCPANPFVNSDLDNVCELGDM